MSRVCPLCGEEYWEPPAISRADDRSVICSGCGIRQAVEGNVEEDIEELVRRNKEMRW